MDKSQKNKRMSLDPAKNPQTSLHQKHYNATEIEVKNNSRDESQFSISNNHSHDHYQTD
jgi:hypothetical protein